MDGWVKLYRVLLNKAIWYESTPEQKVILITLLLMTNHKEKEWEWQGQKYTAKPGQFVTSLKKIAEKSGKGISIQNVRTCLLRLEKYEFLTSKSTNKNRLITILNWESYQSIDERPNKDANKQLTSNQQATNKQLTTNKNVRSKECKNERSKASTAGNPEAAEAAFPLQDIVDLFNHKCKSFREIKHITAKRKKEIWDRWQDYDGNMEAFNDLFSKAQNSDFLKGGGPRGWQADFDWIIQQDNMARILEGAYDENYQEGVKNDKVGATDTGFEIPEGYFSEDW